MNFLWVLLAVLFTFIPVAGWAADEPDFWELVAKRPDATITGEKGHRTAHFSGGVTISEDGLGMDDSGKGAVLCTGGMLLEARAFTSVCDNGKETDATRRLDEALSKINDFIATNSIVPISRDELEKVYQDRLSKKISKYQEEGGKEFCKSDDISAKFLRHFMAVPEADFNKNMDDFLSVPRPPVMNPCL